MTNVLIRDTTMSSIAGAIRDKLDVETAYLPAEMPAAIESITTGEPQDGEYLCEFINYRGEVYQSGYYNEGDTVTFPSDPEMDGLIFQSWVAPVDQVDGTLTMPDQDLTVGALFTTVSGCTEFDVVVNSRVGLDFTLQGITGLTYIDWGDGTTSEECEVHSYEVAGTYTIVVHGDLLVFAGYIFGQSSTSLSEQIMEIRAGANSPESAAGIAIRYNRSTAYLSTAVEKFKIANNSLQNWASLEILIVTGGIFGGYSCYFCNRLRKLACGEFIFADNAAYMFRAAYLLGAVPPIGGTTIGAGGFYECTSIRKIKIQSTIENIGASAFAACYSLRTIDLTAFSATDTPPTLSDVSAFNYLSPSAQFVFSDTETLANFAEATNWLYFADQFVIKE